MVIPRFLPTSGVKTPFLRSCPTRIVTPTRHHMVSTPHFRTRTVPTCCQLFRRPTSYRFYDPHCSFSFKHLCTEVILSEQSTKESDTHVPLLRRTRSAHSQISTGAVGRSGSIITMTAGYHSGTRPALGWSEVYIHTGSTKFCQDLKLDSINNGDRILINYPF